MDRCRADSSTARRRTRPAVVPACVAALNTPAESASATVFVEVLRRSFNGSTENSSLVVPRADLTELLPAPALREVATLGGELCLGAPVESVSRAGPAGASVRVAGVERRFDAAIIATGPQHVARLLPWDTSGLATNLASLRYEPISTLHFEFAYVFPGVDPAVPMLMLDGDPGQWLFWHRLPNGHQRASVVISAHHRGSRKRQSQRQRSRNCNAATNCRHRSGSA